MANAWEQVQWIASEALLHMEDNLIISRIAGRDMSAEFNVRPNGYAVGDTVRIKNNPVFEAKEFAGSVEYQDIRASKRELAIEKLYDVSAKVTAREKRLDMVSFSEEVIRPAAYALAEKVEYYMGTKVLEGAGLYVSDNLFTTAADMALAKKAATFQQLSATGRFCMLDDTMEARLLGADYFNTYNNRGNTGERVFNEGDMGRAMKMDFFSSLQFPTTLQDAGNGVGTTNNTGTTNLVGLTTLTTDATTGTFQVGDRIQVAGMRRPLIVAAQATVGATTITLADPITEIVPDGAAITVIGSAVDYTIRGAIMDDRSIAMAMPMLDPASSKPSSVVSNNGLSIRVVLGYDMDAKTEAISLDCLVGGTCHDPRRVTLLGEY